MRGGLRLVAAVFASLLAVSVLASGQSATTSLRGTISDSKGAVVIGATVTLNSQATGFSRKAVTDDQGTYQFLQVPPASYVMTVTAAGFATTKRENVVLQVSSPATVNLALQVQGGSVIVDVTGEAPVVNTQDATLGNNFNARQLSDLPSESRDPAAILSLQPGVTYIGNTTNDQQMSDSRGGAVNGARSDQSNITVDGLDDNDQLEGFALRGRYAYHPRFVAGVSRYHRQLRRRLRTVFGRASQHGDEERHQHLSRFGLRILPAQLHGSQRLVQ